ncbi:MAG: iron ABC transporter permease [Myxococcota bacterium]
MTGGRERRRHAVAIALSALLCALALAAAPLVGATTIDVRRALDGKVPLADNPDAQILFGARLPRAAAAALVGSGLAASGAVLQAILRNPLADPFTLGVSGGAALGAAIAIRLGLDAALPGGLALSAAAFLGALLAVAVVWSLARRGAVVVPATLLLAGVTLSFVAGATIVLLQHTADLASGLRITRWTLGSLDGLRLELLAGALPVWGAGLGVSLLLARSLNALAAGAETAASVGVDVDRATRAAYLAASLLVGALVALAGPIGFVGLIVPHLARAVVGADHRVLIPVCVFTGGAFLIACDVLARVMLSPADLPVGVLTALMGGPFFLFLLRRRGGLA